MAIKNDNVLNGWGELSEYLRVTVRTVQNWEAFHKLPIHRPVKNGLVYAYKTEIEAWRTRNSSKE